MIEKVAVKAASVLNIVLILIGCGSSQHESLDEKFGQSWNLLGNSSSEPMLIGAGIADITGPMVGLATMGYAAPAARTSGLHQRLWARSFVIEGQNHESSTNTTLVYSLIDACFVTHAVKAEVINRLQRLYGKRFDHANVMITATHTHSGPGGFSAHHLYNQPSGGFSPENFDLIVSGIVRSIEQAYQSRQPGRMSVASGHFSDMTRNRSLQAYLRNPQAERNSYSDATDSEATVLRFDALNGSPIGMLNWYAAHATSIDKFNSLISGDNKGYAAWKFESDMGMDYQNRTGFVAGFANSNAGDASPNIAGDVDGDGDWECSANENFACAKESGEKHLAMAVELYGAATSSVGGPLRVAHRFVDFSKVDLSAELTGTGFSAKTCSGAIGISMLAGSQEDGPGVGREGVSCSTGGPIARLRCLQPKFYCHGEKPVALPTGSMGYPSWTPNELPIQIFVIGQVALVAVPSEMTSMAGRRLRNHLSQTLAEAGVERVVLAGYANAFSNYVATREEYQAQHYEGASTLFGEWTSVAYKKMYGELAHALVKGTDIPSTTAPKLIYPSRKATIPLGFDRTPIGRRFGQVIRQPLTQYRVGQRIEVEFQASNLNHSLGSSRSLFEVQRLIDGAWTAVVHDWDFTTRLQWRDQGLKRSSVRVIWETDNDTKPGSYRIIFRGRARQVNGQYVSYEGRSNTFLVR